MAEPIYATADDLREKLDVDDTALPDGRAIALLSGAEDWVDRIAGPIALDRDTGRKFDPANLSSLQAAALAKATLTVAAVTYSDPAAFTSQTFGKVSGPDFTLENPASLTGLSGPAVATLRSAAAFLDAARLRVLRGALRR